MGGFWGTAPAAGRRLQLRDAELLLQHRHRRRRANKMRRIQPALIAFCVLLISGAVYAQTPKPDLSGTWVPYRGAGGGRGARGSDPLAAVPAGAPVLKPQYAKDYETRTAAERAATQRGEPGPTNGMLCVPYGVPTMMSVAVYPVEF